MNYLKIITPIMLGLSIGIGFGYKGIWGLGTYQMWLFVTSYFLGILITGCLIPH